MPKGKPWSPRRKNALWVAVVCLIPVLVYAQWQLTSPLYLDGGSYRSTEVLLEPDGRLVAHVLVAEGDVQLQKGLVGRTVNDTGGMLLVLPELQRCTITMRDMKQNIDVLFIDGKKNVVDIKKDVPPMSMDPSTWGSCRSDTLCIYVLELHAGRAAALGMTSGALLNFTI